MHRNEDEKSLYHGGGPRGTSGSGASYAPNVGLVELLKDAHLLGGHRTIPLLPLISGYQSARKRSKQLNYSSASSTTHAAFTDVKTDGLSPLSMKVAVRATAPMQMAHAIIVPTISPQVVRSSIRGSSAFMMLSCKPCAKSWRRMQPRQPE